MLQVKPLILDLVITQEPQVQPAEIQIGHLQDQIQLA